MKNKIFAILFSAIFLFMLIGAPATLILTKYGIIEYNNVGNAIVTDKTYDESTALGRFFAGIEDGKVKIKDTYINNLPFFLKITNSYKPLKSSIDQPVIDWLQNKGNEATEYVCRHVYNTETVVATCTEGGYTLKTCRLCSETITEDETKALGHSFEETSTVSVTCESDGYTLMTCSVCSAIEQRNVTEALGHDYIINESKPATCTEKGLSEYSCSRCDFSYSMETDKLVHSYKDDVCELCGQARPSEGDHECEYVHSSKASTCTTQGWTESTCTICGRGTSADLPLAPHSYKDGVCTVCGDKNDDATDSPTEEKPVETHQHSYSVTTVAPSCTAEGYDKYTCECGDSYSENRVPPSGHKYTATVIPATCTTEGYTDRKCSVCGDTQKADIVAAKGHSYTVTTVAPTYTEEGYDLHTCSLCKDSYKDNTVPMLENIIPEPKTTPDPEGTKYTASLKTTDNIFRHYAITATYPDGVSKTTYARIVKLDRELLRENMLQTARLINAMVDKDRNVNWYLSYATNLEATEIGTAIVPQESTRHIYEEFLTVLDPSVKVDAVKVNSFNDYFDKFYITDHHWNYHGSEEAYMNIVRMLRENYPDIVPVDAELYEFNDVQFFGSLSRVHANYNVWDPFGVYYRKLGAHDVIFDKKIAYGSESSQSINLKKYQKGEFETAQGYNHYTEFYRVAKEIKYRNNNTGRNLLLIGDSFSLPLLEVVASHFDKTFVRYEDRSWNNFPEELIYETFIKENNITDVIVIEEMSKNIMQGYGEAYPSGFLNIFPDNEW